jgi:hypothetical protein
MGVSGQRHAQAVLLPPGKGPPGTHCTVGWVGTQPVWIQKLEEKSFDPAGHPVVQPVTRHCTDTQLYSFAYCPQDVRKIHFVLFCAVKVWPHSVGKL